MDQLKKIIALVLIATLISLSFAGCKEKQEHPGKPPSEEAVTEELPDPEALINDLAVTEHPTEHPK